MRGHRFRFVTTHLDSVVPAIRVAQAKELLLTAANTSLPVVMAGDFNIAADTWLDPSFPAYQAIINAGFTDAWQSKRASDPGFTAHQAENLLNPTSLLSHRIDLVLFRGGFGVADINLIGDQPADRTRSGLWPSDHAGVAATLRFPARHADSRRLRCLRPHRASENPHEQHSDVLKHLAHDRTIPAPQSDGVFRPRPGGACRRPSLGG